MRREGVNAWASEFPNGNGYSRRFALGVLGGLSLIYALSVLFTPATGASYSDYPTICGFKNFTGLPCPGCGLTHSFCALGKGDLGSAFSFNLLGPPLFLFTAVWWIYSLSVVFRWRTPTDMIDRVSGRLKPGWALLIVFGIFGVLRIIHVLMDDFGRFSSSPLGKFVHGLIG